MIHIIDHRFLSTPHSVASFLIKDNQGYTLVESGPYSTHDTLLAALQELGVTPKEVHTLLLTHIHFDHAGAAWWWAAQGTQVYVHPRGLKHMIDPGRLYQSARQIYGDRMEELWGQMNPIDAERITAVEDRRVLQIAGHDWTAHHTPGHASHHIAWELDGEVFTGDVGGCRIEQGPAIPPLPPPDINRAAWTESIARLRSLGASAFYLTHYGRVTDTDAHLTDLQDRLGRYFEWITPYYRDGTEAATIEPLFKRFVTEELRDRGVGENDMAAYLAANPPYMSVVGMLRCLQLEDRNA
ncbi:hypothetical protein LEM8419_01500 [Neolewinella maritima]|uniref:Metallo-beta-lactamase domain-containing protein n=1 Tax=Neolewinella maritima TaxID=1383882 RepID=A0ABN8F1W7_9BACT|nr:MBL fold metallo-hydrolase [Neolewinella maritima]CAH1000347.1 hypothetical protein LEM8419_01500 [Neolewinella maritima]